MITANGLTRFLSIVVLLHFTIILCVEACDDTTTSCILFQDLCEETPFLQNICPFTCNRCPEDPCTITNGGCSQICSWKDGIVTCSCMPGFKLTVDDKTCVDINECTEGPNPCNNDLFQSCVNTIGSYYCQDFECQKSFPGKINYYKSKVCCTPKDGSCGINQYIRRELKRNELKDQPRISSGSNAALASWPWMVQLTTGVSHLCGGTLLTNSWVVTSSDCLQGLKRKDILVTLGHVRNAVSILVDIERQEQRNVDEIIRHPSEVKNGHEQNNIALLKLSAPVNYTEKVGPICLPCGELPKEGEKCWVTGFGTIGDDPNLPLASILQEVDVPIVGINECIRAFKSSSPNIAVNRNTMICAGYEEGGKDACNGDGGGPMMCQRADSCQWYLTGITGFGVGCGRKGFYGIYTNVFRFEEWIRKTLKEDAADLCDTSYNPCSFYENEKLGCNSLPNVCEGSLRGDCALTCCLRENKQGRDSKREGDSKISKSTTDGESNCFDDPDFTAACNALKEQCENPELKPFLFDKCPKTCAVC